MRLNFFILLILLYFAWLAALAQMVAYLPLVQQVLGSIPGGVVNFNSKIFNLGARRGGGVHYLIRSMYVEKAYSTVGSDSSVGWGR